MRILICNDDGIFSPGIAVLADVASEYGEVRVVAPDAERSSMGHAITASRPLAYRPTVVDRFKAFRVNGTPADCVAVGVHHWEGVDLVLSGINLGFNLGNGIWHSGTLAAAKQAVLLGIRGIALSAPAGAETDFKAFKPWARQVLETLMHRTELMLVNVNIPRDPHGMVWTRVSVRHYEGRIVPINDPYGRELYWFAVTPTQGAEEGTDRWALEQGWISLTPLRVDLTDEVALEQSRLEHPLDEARAAVISRPSSTSDQVQSVLAEEAQPVAEAIPTPVVGVPVAKSGSGSESDEST